MRILIHIKKEPTFHCGNRKNNRLDFLVCNAF
nr:MAG TPA: hypothetical protein [Caudoviricetes sp.]